LRLPWKLKRESKPIDSPFGWWFVDSNGEKWKSVDEGETWHKIVCRDLDDWECEPKIIYVCGSYGGLEPHSDDHNDGLSPATAKRTISAALDMADANDTVHVFSGVYHEENKQLQFRSNFYMTDSVLYLGEKGTLTYEGSSFLMHNYICRS